jgi:hypothetical protein
MPYVKLQKSPKRRSELVCSLIEEADMKPIDALELEEQQG